MRIPKARSLFDRLFSDSFAVGYYMSLVGRTTLQVVIHGQICLVQNRKLNP